MNHSRILAEKGKLPSVEYNDFNNNNKNLKEEIRKRKKALVNKVI